jgi:hypothetical protein
MSKYQFRVEFDTGDHRYHVGAFYQINLSFSPEQIDLTWDTSFTNVSGNPWTISDGGRSLRFDIEDSANCGGSNAETQTGEAITIIELPSSSTIKTSGGKVLLRGGKPSCQCCLTPFGLLARGTSAGGELLCEMGPIISEYLIEPPYRLSGTVYLDLNFSGVGELESTGFENIAFYLEPFE